MNTPKDVVIEILKLYPFFLNRYDCAALWLCDCAGFALVKIYWVFNIIYRVINPTLTNGYKELLGSKLTHEKNSF